MNFKNDNYSNNVDKLNNELVDLHLIYKIILREKKLIFIITFIPTLVSIIFNLFQKPIYKGNFEIVVRNNDQSSFNSRNFSIVDITNISSPSKSSTQEIGGDASAPCRKKGLALRPCLATDDCSAAIQRL